MSPRLLVALAGQPNCGKSTVFNALTGARQHIANYPGVTVEKKVGAFQFAGLRVELVDLPGTYSLTSYSLEERVARDFLLNENPSAVINVADAASIKRSLYFTLQVLEMGLPVVVDVNRMDVARRRGVTLDHRCLSRLLGVEVIPTSFKAGKGRKRLLEALDRLVKAPGGGPAPVFAVDYGPMEPMVRDLEKALTDLPGLSGPARPRWLAVKLMEGDDEARRMVAGAPDAGALLARADRLRADFESEQGEAPEQHTAYRRYHAVDHLVRECVTLEKTPRVPLSDRVDLVVCHRLAGPAILVLVIYGIYWLAIVQGERLLGLSWDLLLGARTVLQALLPAPGLVTEPVFRTFALWFADSINSLLIYAPVFFILFFLIAVLEDMGYMPRMAFMLDRIFRRFGLHGQSTLPMVLGGVYAGGCAVPGIMSCRGIPDQRARHATILIIPMLNCLAKVPLYVLMVEAFFPQHKGPAMFFISTIALLMALPVAKVLSLTVLKNMESAPFLMEMPPYNLPGVLAVAGVAFQRVWLYIRKIVTVVAAVAVVLFVLFHLPGLSPERKAHYENLGGRALEEFFASVRSNPLAPDMGEAGIFVLAERWSVMREGGVQALAGGLAWKTPLLERLLAPQAPEERQAARALEAFADRRAEIMGLADTERLTTSLLGRFGRFMEPVTRFAGFDWRVNVALASAVAAKESSVATLGALYQGPNDSTPLAETLRKKDSGFSPRSALALMLFMALYPPCMAAMAMIKAQTGSWKWMAFAVAYPVVLAMSVACLVYTGSGLLGLSGIGAMYAFWGLAMAVTVVMGFIPPAREP